MMTLCDIQLSKYLIICCIFFEPENNYNAEEDVRTFSLLWGRPLIIWRAWCELKKKCSGYL